MNREPKPRIIPMKWKQHLLMLYRYGSFRKACNLLNALWGYTLGKAKLTSFPPFLKIEVSNQCHVRCRYCYQKKSGSMYPFERFTLLMDSLAPYLFEVSLHDIGEPLLHERILDFVRYAHARRVGTIISTTLSLEKHEAFWRELVGSGLDRLVVAIDGLEPLTYNQYRTRGDLTLVMRNLHRILVYRKETASALHVTWQMIDLPWNRHEHAAARKLAAKLGCDSFTLIQEETLLRRKYYESARMRTRQCLMPFMMFIVSAEGKIRPCCNIYRGITDSLQEDNIVGDLNAQTFDAVWNSPEVQQIRTKALISGREYCRLCREM